jgi:hypothetical protein
MGRTSSSTVRKPLPWSRQWPNRVRAENGWSEALGSVLKPLAEDRSKLAGRIGAEGANPPFTVDKEAGYAFGYNPPTG